jgi:leucyl aminopeptidase
VLEIRIDDAPLASVEADLVVVGAYAPATPDGAPEPGHQAAAVLAALGIDAAAELDALGLTGKPGSMVRIATRGALPATAVAVVGLGRRDDLTLERLRRAAGAVASSSERLARIAVGLAEEVPAGASDADAVRAVVEGLALGAYRFTQYRSDATPSRLEDVAVCVDADRVGAARAALADARVATDATLLVRDLVNTPPQDKRPPALAERVAALFADTAVTVRVLDEQDLAEGGYGGILAVGQGSSAPPRLVELRWSPAGASAHVGLVGKGITFDTGGISLKPSEAMETMKMDMAGAATVAAVVRAAAALELPIEVTGVLALAENMPSGTATRVSDVIRMRSGRTVEVMNTDAEGRLVLGDGIAHVAELGATTIVDVATLTGAVIIALGDDIAAVIANDDALADALLASAARAGEPLWRLPLASEQYADKLEGMTGDIRNVTGRAGGTLMGGLFLHRFVPDGVAWAHLDIAGVAWSADNGPLRTKGGTGASARTLLDWLRGVASAGA